MARVLLTTIFLLSLSSGLTQAATQEAECGASEITQALLDDPENYAYFDDSAIWQGWFRGLAFRGTAPRVWDNIIRWAFEDDEYSRWGECLYNGEPPNTCGGASENFQICWSEAPFTLNNTSNGETCVSTVPAEGIRVARDQTVYVISIDRRGAETEYCQIEFKTLATGEAVPSGPPGTGATSVVGLKGTDPETDETPDGPLQPEYRPTMATPVMPHLVLIVLTGLLASIGVRHVRRRKAASLSA